MRHFFRICTIAAFIVALTISLGCVVPTPQELAITFSLFAGSVCLWLSR